MPQVVEGILASSECSEDVAGDGDAHQYIDACKEEAKADFHTRGQ